MQVAFKENHIGWSEDEETRLKKLFIEAILVDQTFLAYLPNAGKNFEDDLEIIKYILKNFLLKHPSMTEFFEEKDLNWNLNKDVVKSMSTKTFKIEALEDLSLQPLALQWEDDKSFFEGLYEFTLDSDKDKEAVKNFKVSGFPTIILKSEGETIEYEGARTKEELINFVNQYSK